MGSTVSTAKLVGAFQGNDGQLCYALFEQTYDKNCHPHNPKWSAMRIGDLAATMKAIFSYASSCEGECCKVPVGDLLPLKGTLPAG